MAIARLQRAFPSAYAGYRVSIRDASSGQPARLYSSLLGGLVTATGNTLVNSAGQLDTFLDGSRQYSLTVYDPRGRKADSVLGLSVEGQVSSGEQVAAHEATFDPHPQYLTPVEANSAYATADQGTKADTALQASAILPQTNAITSSTHATITASTTAIGTNTKNLAPAFVRSIGQSTSVAAAIEAFSAAMPKDARWNDPRIPEQGVIEFDAGVYTLEKPVVIDLSSATTSRYGLTLRGQGNETTKFITSTTAAKATFCDPFGDGVWRMMRIHSSVNGVLDSVRLEDFGLVQYFTQNGDGTTRFADPCRTLETNYINSARYSNLTVYIRSLTALSSDQVAYYIRRNYYGGMLNCRAHGFIVTNAGYNLQGSLASRRGGRGFHFEENNAFTATKILSTGFDAGLHLQFEDGFSAFGVDIEHTNKSITLADRCKNVEIRGVRDEKHTIESGGQTVEAPADTWLVKFSSTCTDNIVQVASGANSPTVANVIDLSPTRSNRVLTSTQAYVSIRTPVPLTPVNAGVTSTTNTLDLPLGHTGTDVTEISWPGSYNQNRAWTFTIDPRIGAVTVRMFIKRISGDGMMIPRLETTDNNPVFYGTLIDPLRRYQASGLAGTIHLADSGHSWAAGTLTLTARRAHQLQVGMRLQAGTTLGALASGTNLYVASTPSPYTFTALTSDPGAIAVNSTITVPFDMQNWLAQPNVTADWVETIAVLATRTTIQAITLNGASKPVITLDGTATNWGLATGITVNLHGFVDPRLNTNYTIGAGDISGSTLTLAGLAAMPDLVTTPSAAIDTLDPLPRYGYLGLRDLRITMRGVTTSGTACVWRCTDPVVHLGVHKTMVL